MNKRRLVVLVVTVVSLIGVFLWRRGASRTEHEEDQQIDTEVAVQVGKITHATLHAYVVAYGMVEPEPANGGKPAASARIASIVPGVVATADCIEGQQVEKGTALFHLDSRIADAAVLKAKVAVEFAEKTLARHRQLLKVDGTSQKQVQEAQQQLDTARNDLAQAQTQRTYHTIAAPLAGRVVRVNARPGETVDATTVLAELVDFDRLVVSANVPSTELAALKTGQQVELSTPRSAGSHAPDASSLPHGTLSFVGLQVDTKTGSAPVRISVPGGSELRPGQFVSVRIITEEHTDRLAVPAESVVKQGDNFVIAAVTDDRAVQKPVKVGLRESGLVEIEGEGLTEGMTVVTKGAYGLPKETKIRAAEH